MSDTFVTPTPPMILEIAKGSTEDELMMLELQLAIFGYRTNTRLPGDKLMEVPIDLGVLSNRIHLEQGIASGFVSRRFPEALFIHESDLSKLPDPVPASQLVIFYSDGIIVRGIVGGSVGHVIVAIPFTPDV